MTMTTRVRFLDPVDPRTVWERAALLVKAPENYRSEVRRQRDGDYLTIADPDQGAEALLLMYSGNDGGRLIRDVDGYADDSPPAYVELCFNQPYSCCDSNQHDSWVSSLWVWRDYGGRVLWFRGECCADWHIPSDPTRRPMPACTW